MKLPTLLENFLKNNLLRIEFICVAAFFIGYFLELMSIGGLALTTLACVYFFSSQFQYLTLTFFERIIYQATPIAWSIVTIGIMFWVLRLPGHEVQLLVGLIACTVLSFLFLIRVITKPEFTHTAELIRTIALAAISTAIYFIDVYPNME